MELLSFYWRVSDELHEKFERLWSNSLGCALGRHEKIFMVVNLISINPLIFNCYIFVSIKNVHHKCGTVNVFLSLSPIVLLSPMLESAAENASFLCMNCQ
jgi:hypothetical protein